MHLFYKRTGYFVKVFLEDFEENAGLDLLQSQDLGGFQVLARGKLRIILKELHKSEEGLLRDPVFLHDVVVFGRPDGDDFLFLRYLVHVKQLEDELTQLVLTAFDPGLEKATVYIGAD